MTDAQARRLWDAAAALRAPGRILEIGSYRGRSAIVLALAADDGVEVIAVDPHAGNDRGPQQLEGSAAEGQSDNDAFRANLERTGVAGRVRHVREPSRRAFGAVEGHLDILYVDGSHRYFPALGDLQHWGGRVVMGGTMLVHDSFTSIGVTLALLRACVAGGGWEYVGRSGSLAEYRRARMSPARRARSAARQIALMPWFARNVLVKIAIVLRLWPLTRLLGHNSRNWPY